MPLCVLQVMLLVAGGRFTWLEATVVGFPLALLYSIICLSSWYLCRVQPLSQTSIARLATTFVMAGLLTSSYWLLAGRLWTALLGRIEALKNVPAQYAEEMTLLYVVGILLFLLAVAAHYLAITFEESREADRNAFQLQLLAQEAELRALKFQINPHFLFNSLNSVSALTSSDPKGARHMCLLLAQFLRQSLSFGTQEKITLSRELDLARDYLAIEKVRRSSSLDSNLEAATPADRALVPPLILQPLVENAVKHGISHLLEGGVVSVRAEVDGERLRIRVENPFDPDSSRRTGSGLGLLNVRKRLESVYEKNAQMTVEETGSSYKVRLSLPVELSDDEKPATTHSAAG